MSKRYQRWGNYIDPNDGSPKRIKAYSYKYLGKLRRVYHCDISQEQWDSLPESTDECGYTYREIPITKEVCDKRYKDNCRSAFPNHRGRVGTDTRRFTWKMFGNHHGEQWHGTKTGKYWKNRLDRINRRRYLHYLSMFNNRRVNECLDIYDNYNVQDGSYPIVYSTVSWRDT